MQGSATGSKLAVSSSDRMLRLLDSSTLQIVTTFHGHKDTINALVSSKQSDSIYYSSSADKCVAVWDQRASSTPICRLRLDDDVMSVAVNGQDGLLAAACGEEIVFFDIRKLASTAGAPKLGTYDDLHSNLVTNLLFSAEQEHLLISGGEDGLVCVCDTSIGEAEEAVSTVLNTDCAVRRIGLFGPPGSREGIFCLSTVECASFWHFPSAQRIAQCPGLREEHNVDYLVDCMADGASLRLLSGRYDGAASLLSVEPSGCSHLANMEQGHSDVVRCCAFLPQREIMYTGGEDGQVIAWQTAAGEQCPSEEVHSEGMADMEPADEIHAEHAMHGGSEKRRKRESDQAEQPRRHKQHRHDQTHL